MSEQEARAEAAQRRERAPGGAPHPDDPSEALRAAWGVVDAEIRAALGDSPGYRIWLAHLHPHARLAGAWHVGVDPRGARWVAQRFGRIIEHAAGGPVLYVPCDRARLGGQPDS